MQGMFSMSQILYNQVDQIADAKMCKINNVETKCYKVRWKCTWEPETVLQKFCGDIIDEYKQNNVCHNKNDLEELAKEKENDFVATHIGEKLIDKYGISEAENVIDEIEAICSSNHETLPFRDDLGRNNEKHCASHTKKNTNNITQKKLSSQTSFTSINTGPCCSEKMSDSETFPKKSIFDIPVEICNSKTRLPIETPKITLNQLVKNEQAVNNANESVSTRYLANSVFKDNMLNQSEEIVIIDTVPMERVTGVSTEIVDNSFKQINKRHNPRFNCQVCSYSTPLKANLKSHMRKHTGEKPYKCNQCSYAAAHLHLLKIHQGKHDGEHKYKCNQCPYKGWNSIYLKLHMRKHAIEKEFKCETCTYSTSYKSNLKVHMCNNIEKLYKCNICSFSGVHKQQLQFHLHTKHKIGTAE